MSIVDFDYLKVTTMTVIVKLTGNTVIENVFPLLDITRLDLPPPLRPTKKYKIPYCAIPGAILSAKFQNVTRGIIKSKGKKSFLNSITIDLCTSVKNINAKLSGGKIHMCGPNSEALAVETAEHIIEHLLNLQDELDYINEDIDERDNAIQWLKDNCKGKDYIIDTETQEIIKMEEGETINEDSIIIKSDGSFRLKEKIIKFESWNIGDFVTDNSVICNQEKEPYIILTSKGKKEQAVLNHNFFVKTEYDDLGNLTYKFMDPSDNPINMIIKESIKIMKVNGIHIPEGYPDIYPDNINEEIANFYIKYVSDFAYYHVYCQFLDGVKNIIQVASKDLAIEKVDMAMINYSYSLGMSVDRWTLLNAINGRNGFTARYCNSTDHSVTISLPYVVPESRKGVRRKNKPPRHTFMVHKSGIVTQSGPNIDLMRGAYYRFMATIMQIRPMIIQKDQPFNLKFIPKYIPEYSPLRSKIVEIPVAC